HLLRGRPPERMGAEWRGRAFDDAGLVQVQVHRQVLVGVADGEALSTDLQPHAELLAGLTEKSLCIGLPGLDLSARELPEERAALSRQSLLYQVAARGGLDERRHHPDLPAHRAPGLVTCRP